MSSVPQARPTPKWLSGADAAIPVMPMVAMKVIELTSNPNVSIAQLSSAVSKDQVLASRVLGLANSAYSGSMHRISTVTDAIVRLGIGAVRNVVVTVCFTSRMHDPKIYGALGPLLVDHAIGTAYMARLVADKAGADADEAFLYGLLHDIGKLVILKLAHDHKRRTGQAIGQDELDEALSTQHASFGGFTLRRLSLPDELDEPVSCHHDYAAATTRRKEALIAYCANRLSHRYGFGCDPDETDLTGDAGFAELGLDAAWLAETDERAPGLFKIARQFLA
ncbi:MAG: HDOD domain-containing protein [Vicinamibacterales bacterium]